LEVGAANQEPETSLQGANKSKNKPSAIDTTQRVMFMQCVQLLLVVISVNLKHMLVRFALF
jgi:hypothetical protein